MPENTTLPKISTGATPTYNALWTARFLQLTSSALNNFASPLFTQTPANSTTKTERLTIIKEDGSAVEGYFENNAFVVNGLNEDGEQVLVTITKENFKPSRLFRQGINDAFNSRYVGEHNLGVVSFHDKTVTNYFYTSNGKDSERTWNFTNSKRWE